VALVGGGYGYKTDRTTIKQQSTVLQVPTPLKSRQWVFISREKATVRDWWLWWVLKMHNNTNTTYSFFFDEKFLLRELFAMVKRGDDASDVRSEIHIATIETQ
jgi:hypothetical protein